MAKITNISEVSFKSEASWGTYDGLVVSLDNGTDVKVGISDGQSCCENWGYITSEDNYEDFIGAELISVAGVDSKLAHVELQEIHEGDMMFVNFNTSEGVLQFVAYNEHNGYYAHEAVLIVGGNLQESWTL